MSVETKKNMRIWVSRFFLHIFLERFETKIFDTVFDASTLVEVDRDNNDKTVCLELYSDLTKFVEIPDHILAGLVQFENGETLIKSFDNSLDWQSLLPSITADRCDVCHVKHLRNKVFIVKNVETGKILVVGGSCSRKFTGYDLEKILSMMQKFEKDVENELREEYEGYKLFRDLCWELSICEFLIKKTGYLSRKQAEFTEIMPTASALDMVAYAPNLSDHFSKEDLEIIRNRRNELIETELKEYKDHFEAKLKETFSDFNHNCVSLLNGGSARKSGYTAYMASCIAQPKSDTKIETTGLLGTLNKMTDFNGTFEIVKYKPGSNMYNDYIAITAINENNEKVWFKCNCGSQAERALFEDDSSKITDRFQLRGKLTEIKDNITFAKNVKVLSKVS